jgi:hypothetical protein
MARGHGIDGVRVWIRNQMITFFLGRRYRSSCRYLVWEHEAIAESLFGHLHGGHLDVWNGMGWVAYGCGEGAECWV